MKAEPFRARRHIVGRERGDWPPVQSLGYGLLVAMLALGLGTAPLDAQTSPPKTSAPASGAASAPGKLAAPAPKPAAPEVKPAPLAKPAAPPTVGDGLIYPVGKIVLVYGRDPNAWAPSSGLPTPKVLMALKVTLGKVGDAYVALRQGASPVTMTLEELSKAPVKQMYSSAIRSVNEQIVAEFNRRNLIAVYVAPSEKEIEQDKGRDLRPAGQTDLTLNIWIGVVTKVRTLLAGERIMEVDPNRPRGGCANFVDKVLLQRIPETERIDNPIMNRVRDNSPIQPAGAGLKQRTDLLRKDLLDEYVAFLNRHPGRRVDVSLSADANQPGVVMDYLVTENKPWLAYFQVSNTGSTHTGAWRERFGITHNQVSNNDDVASVDYTTSGFEESYSVMASYEAPFPKMQKLRWKVFWNYSQFFASDLGQAAQAFTGHEWALGGDVIWNFFQKRDLFLDLIGGARWRHIYVNNQTVDVFGEEDFFLPHVGIRAERNTERSSTYALVDFEWNCSGLAGTSTDQTDKLGRLDTDSHWSVLHWDLEHSFFLDPYLYGKEWEDIKSPKATLAHELGLSFRGQRSLGHRLIPQAEDILGGLYTVRGYPESIVAGDTVLLASAEYRYHVPRALKVRPDPSEVLFGKPFRGSPQFAYGRADWDLILRGFFDIGRSLNDERLTIEDDQTLMSVGLGIELQLRQNVSIRLDWGVPLTEVKNGGVDPGDGRLHFVTTISY